MLKQQIENILPLVEKPARYTGGELNSIVKNADDVDIRFAFCFADVYEVGMSHLGMKILYSLMNEREDIWCERVFAPWIDMEAEMRKADIPLYGLESMDAIKDFDFVGFTLQYEMCYTNIINMLDLAKIPLLSRDRKEGDPFVCMGGPCAYSAEALADFADFYILGEGEEVNLEVMDAYKEWKISGGTRFDFLKKISGIEGIYVPSFYEIFYNDDGSLSAIEPKFDFVPKKVRKRIIKDLDKVYYPEKFVVPFIEIVHDRIMLEIFRGCIRGCRFCQAGMIYRPVREKMPDTLLKYAQKLIDSTGYEEISLSSLSTSDYTCLREFTDGLLDITEKESISLSLPSLRLDSFSMELMEKVQKVRKSSLTFAPEAGSQRMRDVINKNITEEDLLTAAKTAFEGGYSSIKLYFMMGLPFETVEDVCEIAELSKKVVRQYLTTPKEKRAPGLRVTASVASFVPKAFTPFQWAKQNDRETLREKQYALKDAMNDKRVKYNYHEAPVSVLEGVFARGDRRLSKVLLKAHELGVRFDGWSDQFSQEKWDKAFEECGMEVAFYTRERSFDEILPWDMIDVGVTKEFLISEAKKAEKAITTPNCREKCSGCGATCFGGGVCYERRN
ncbi:MAG: TIGR03960 family B12-binding radical SAM protein [Ruminococcaceae bacterium]|nr:TIGR03960 family B12-binding radical SAM protein [Oscillospiraceae bacterium]